MSQRNLLIAIGIAFVLAILQSCQDPFRPPATLTDVHYLVIEGFLNGTGTTTIRLSRTAPLTTGSHTNIEPDASVQVEGDDGSTFHLVETNPGSYSADNLAVNQATKYRLKIVTSEGQEYNSEFVPFKESPAIDSVNWQYDGGDIHIYVNTHDDTNNSKYYLWNYEATWAYHSAYYTTIKKSGDTVIRRDIDDDIYHCWRGAHSTNILISSSARLTTDIISNFELVAEPLTSEKLQNKYSILVEQFVLTPDAYEYWQQLKKNTENVGTIFGPQPSQIVSNIHSVTNPSEPVLGYFSAGSTQTFRSFIKYADLPPSRHDSGYEACAADTLPVAQLPNFMGGELLINEIYENLVVIGYLKSTQDCVDCRSRGGTTVKPDYWD